MKKYINKALLLAGLCLGSFVNAQTYNATMNTQVYISAVSFIYTGGDDGFGSNETRFNFSASNPLGGSYSSGCQWHDGVNNSTGAYADIYYINDAIGNFYVNAGNPMPNYITVDFNAHEDDSFISNCTNNSGDDDYCDATAVNVPLTGFQGAPGSITQEVTCGEWKVTFLIQMAVFGSNSCAAPTPFCTNSGVILQATTGNPTPGGNNYGCLASVNSPSWSYLKIGEEGYIDVQMSASSDVDFIIYGPYPDLATATADCGSFGAGDIEDCSYSIASTEHINLVGNVGDIFILMVSNFSGATQTITLSKYAGDGETDCSVIQPCNAAALTTSSPTQTLCYDGSGIAPVTFSAPHSTTKVQYLLVDPTTNVIIANNSTGTFIADDIPDNNVVSCSPTPAIKTYRIYALNYDKEGGLTPIINGTTTILPSTATSPMNNSAEVMLPSPTPDVCMRVSSQYVTVNVYPKLYVEYGTQTCSSNNLTYTQNFQVCGGTGSGYTASVIAGNGTLSINPSTGAGTVSNITQGIAITLQVGDASSCTQRYTGSVRNCTSCPTNPGVFPFAN